MLYGAISRSETQQIIVEVVKQIYPDLQEEVMIDNFYMVDIYIPKKKLIIEVYGPIHYTFSG